MEPFGEVVSLMRIAGGESGLPAGFEEEEEEDDELEELVEVVFDVETFQWSVEDSGDLAEDLPS